MEDPAHRPLAEDTKALCAAITPGAEGLPSSVPDAHLPNARLPPCGGPSQALAAVRSHETSGRPVVIHLAAGSHTAPLSVGPGGLTSATGCASGATAWAGSTYHGVAFGE